MRGGGARRRCEATHLDHRGPGEHKFPAIADTAHVQRRESAATVRAGTDTHTDVERESVPLAGRLVLERAPLVERGRQSLRSGGGGGGGKAVGRGCSCAGRPPSVLQPTRQVCLCSARAVGAGGGAGAAPAESDGLRALPAAAHALAQVVALKVAVAASGKAPGASLLMGKTTSSASPANLTTSPPCCVIVVIMSVR